jgi:uncharacterized Zn-binding protein involved in type VI secretion
MTELEKIATGAKHICPGFYLTHGRAIVEGEKVIPVDGKKYNLPVKYCTDCNMAIEDLKLSWSEARFYFP